MLKIIIGWVSLCILAIFFSMSLPDFIAAKAKAKSTWCANYLMQINSGARMYADQHNGVFPSDFRSMSNLLGQSTTILVCPSDKNRAVASDFASLTTNNISYEMVSPGMNEGGTNYERVFVRCPIHGHEALGDGSVRRSEAKR